MGWCPDLLKLSETTKGGFGLCRLAKTKTNHRREKTSKKGKLEGSERGLDREKRALLQMGLGIDCLKRGMATLTLVMIISLSDAFSSYSMKM